MPGRLFLTTPVADLAQLSGVPCDLDEPARLNIAPGQEVLTLTPSGFQRMRWGIIPVGRVNARGRPVMETIINARSETLFDKSAFDGVARTVVPADGWYEWTGKARRKTPWRLRREDGAVMWFAAISDCWIAPGGGVQVDQVATVTCPPNLQVAKIHHRMGVLLQPEQIDIWLNGSEAQARGLLQALPEGELCIEKALDVDWSAA